MSFLGVSRLGISSPEINGNQAGQETPVAARNDFTQILTLCDHCEMLGASAVIRPDSEVPDVLHCTLCKLSFHFVTESDRLTVTQIKPYTGET